MSRSSENIEGPILVVHHIAFFRSNRFLDLVEEVGEGVLAIEWCRRRRQTHASGATVGAIMLTPSSRTVYSTKGESLQYSGTGENFPKDLED